MGNSKITYPVDFIMIGKRIQEHRNRCKKTQQKLAEEMDITVEYLSRIENGKIKFNLVTLYFIADKLEVLPEDLISGTSSLTKNYLDKELADVFHACTPEKKRIIYNHAKDILNL